MMRSIIAAFALFFFAQQVYATTYYVGLTGSDANTSGQAQVATTPWLTLQHAAGVAAAGDTVLVEDGTYFQTNGVVSATVNAGGTGGTAGSGKIVTGTTGTTIGTQGFFTASVTVSAGAIASVQSITFAGAYTINPTVPGAEPVTGDSLVGAKLNVVMGSNTTGPGNAILYDGNNGTSGNPITYKAQNKWRAIINGQNANSIVSNGFWFDLGAHDITVQDFAITQVYDLPIEVKGVSGTTVNNISLIGNHIYENGHSCNPPFGASGIFSTYGSNILMSGNVIHNNRRLFVGEQACATSAVNLDHGIYIGGGNNGVKIINNVIWGQEIGWGIQLFNGSSLTDSNVSILFNTFYSDNPNRAGAITLSEATSNLLIQSNIFYNTSTLAATAPNGGITCGGGQSGTGTISYNITTANPTNPTGCTGLVFSNNFDFTDPLMVNPIGYDFHLKTISPALKQGIPVSYVTTDVDGNPRPSSPAIGAYEYAPGITGWTPGCSLPVPACLQQAVP